MNNLSALNKQSTKQEILDELLKLFTPYARNLLGSGADFSYMNMYADNFRDQIINQTSISEYDVYTILNEACDLSWRNQVNQ